jgi:DNA-binding NarL/FixJ family response regulator
MSEKLGVFLIDDHAMLREGLTALINAQPDLKVVGQASDGFEALKQIPRCNPQVAVVDLSLPKMSGVRVVEQLKELCPEVRALALTRHCELGYLRLLLQAGGWGYVWKQSGAEVLLSAIRLVASGETFVEPELAGQVVSHYLGRQPQRAEARIPELSEREAEVIRLIAFGYGNKEIAAQLNISIKTVEYHKARSMEKLAFRSRTDIVRYALHQGWLHTL